MTQLTNWTGRRFIAWAIVAGLLAVCSTMLLMPDTASAQGRNRTDIEIDHSRTGFALSGGHAQVVCERCHLQGIFRGTPTQCIQCHSPGGRIVSTFKPANHLPTTVNCDSCHRTTNWTPAFFTHNGVAPGTCATCHNGGTARGKAATHIPTTQSYDTCHRSTTTFTGAVYNHTGIVAGCATCHNGGTALGKPATHVPTTQPCETCHKSTTTFTGAVFNHTGIVAGCATCHNGGTALGKPANHFPTATACETCHKSTTTFSGTRMVHSGVVVTGSCNTCHERGMNWAGGIVTRPNDHNGNKAAPNSCDKSGCHNTSTFSK